MKKIWLTFITACFGTALLSQADTILLDDVTISVTPFEQRLSEATGSLSIKQLDKPDVQHTINIADQLNEVPGVFIGSGTHTTNRVTIRGIGSRTPYSSNRIRAYLEDMPLTNGDGISTIEDMDISGISRAEILKGPSSAIYGSGLGGVILLKALYPKENGFSYRLGGSYGSFNSAKYGASIGFKNQQYAAVAGYAHASSDGFRENNRYRREQVYIHGRSQKNANTFTFHLIGTLLNAEIPSSLNETDFLESPEKAAGNWLNIEGYEKYSRISYSESWKHEFNSRWNNKVTLFSAFSNPYESRPFNILDDKSFTTGLRESLSYETTKFKIQTGAEFFNEAYQWKIFRTNEGEQGELQLHNTETRRYVNIFSHSRYAVTENLNLEAGLNFNILKYSLETLFHSQDEDQSGSYSYNPILSPRIGLNYNIKGTHHVHASTGHGFSAPSLEETLLPEGMVNPDLLPETGWNFDMGIRGKLLNDRWTYDLTAYTIRISNMLVTERITEDIFTGINAGKASLSGIELFQKVELGKAGGAWNYDVMASVFLNNNQFTQFIDDGTDFSGKMLPGIPSAMVHGAIDIRFRENFSLYTDVRYSGKQYMNDENSMIYDGHVVNNGRISYRIANATLPFTLNINAGINNIFNVSYASMILVNAPSFGGAEPRYYYPGMPRNAFIGMNIGF